MNAALAELQRRVANLFRVGKVVEIDRAKARVKVEFNGVKSPWMPWSTGRAGAVRDWHPPSVGEQVCIVSPMGELGAGFVMPGGINSDAHAAPDSRENVHRLDIPSGGAFEIHVGGAVILIDNGKAQIVVGGKTLQIAGGKMTFDGDVEITGKINATGDITSDADVIAGSIHLLTHKHGGVQSGSSQTSTPVP